MSAPVDRAIRPLEEVLQPPASSGQCENCRCSGYAVSSQAKIAEMEEVKLVEFKGFRTSWIDGDS